MGKAQKPCDGCTRCCEYVGMEIDRPVDKQDYNNIRWFVAHKNVFVYQAVEDRKWYLQFDTKCEFLNRRGQCTMYETRSDICREYSTENCETHGTGSIYKYKIENPEQWEQWWDTHRRRKKKKISKVSKKNQKK